MANVLGYHIVKPEWGCLVRCSNINVANVRFGSKADISASETDSNHGGQD
jgi:hypothetical protein